MKPHILDNPIWSSLSTEHAQYGLGSDRARRFQPDISPFAAPRDNEPESLAAFANLVGENETVMTIHANEILLPKGLIKTDTSCVAQMIACNYTPRSIRTDQIELLEDSDAQEMLALATMTRPGPFAIKTNRLGRFYGIKDKGKLVAMVGERLKQPGLTEVSGVCTHPDFQGRKFASTLSSFVTSKIVERGETPYLHVYETNVPAMKLYQGLGFQRRCLINVAEVRRRKPSERER